MVRKTVSASALIVTSTCSRSISATDSAYCLKLSRMACQPACCISGGFVSSASKLSARVVSFPLGVNTTSTFRPSAIVYAIRLWVSIPVYSPSKSKPMLPSLASMRDRSFPPTCRSFSAHGVCHSGEAAFHCVICAGAFQMSHTFFTGAWIVVPTVIIFFFVVSIVILFLRCNLSPVCLPAFFRLTGTNIRRHPGTRRV